MRHSPPIVAAMLVTLIAPFAGAQESRLAEKLDAETRQSVMRVIDTAKALGLPVEPIVEKALLGATFHRPRSAIEGAVKLQLERLQQSKNALDPSSQPEIATGAQAIAEGVPGKTLRQLRTAFPTQMLVVPIAVLTELVAQRVPVQKATDMVRDLMRRGVSEPQLVAFGKEVREDIASGMSPETSLDLRTRGLIAALPPAPGAVAGTAAQGATAVDAPGRKKP
jgi:hypothetical protein